MDSSILKKIKLASFEPYPIFKTGHSQTIAASLLPGQISPQEFTNQTISLDDGDKLSLHISSKIAYKKHSVLMVHGLGGSHLSKYMQRIAPKLIAQGYRVILLNLRGCGSGEKLAKSLYHSGRSQDVRTVIKYLEGQYPNELLTLIGFSLSGNIALKLAGEQKAPPNLHSVIAVSPPLNLHQSVIRICDKENRIFNQYYLYFLNAHVKRLHQHFPELGSPELQNIKTLFDFDDRYTAPRSGFQNALDYYKQSSSLQFIEGVDIPCLILFSQDDPVICPMDYAQLPKKYYLDLLITEQGGHVAWLGNQKSKYFRWMDAVLVHWLNWLIP